MLSRRVFLQYFVSAMGLATCNFASGTEQSRSTFIGNAVFKRIVAQATSGNWAHLPIGQLMGNIAKSFLGTPYVAGTLERFEPEACSVNLTALDCVTFVETTLAFARMLKKGGTSPEDLLNEMALIRYRNGRPGDFTTRLHYTSEWLLDNEDKGILKILSNLPGSIPFLKTIDFMTKHPNAYRQLRAHTEFVAKIKHIEDLLNSRQLQYVPLNKIAAIEPLLQTGDIVAVCTNIPGLDVVHTGMILQDGKGIRHFIDASSRKSNMKVTLEPGSLNQALNWSKDLTGAMFARPLEPAT